MKYKLGDKYILVVDKNGKKKVVDKDGKEVKDWKETVKYEPGKAIWAIAVGKEIFIPKKLR